VEEHEIVINLIELDLHELEVVEYVCQNHKKEEEEE
jgi:hypothetical protein